MAELNKNIIQNLAKLSCIACTPEEEDSLLKDLEKILAYFDQLQEIDTSQVAPCNHVLADIVNVMREDHVENSMPREVFMGNVPSQTGGYVRVPTVIKQS